MQKVSKAKKNPTQIIANDDELVRMGELMGVNT